VWMPDLPRLLAVLAAPSVIHLIFSESGLPILSAIEPMPKPTAWNISNAPLPS